MQLVWVAAAGGALAWLYLAALDAFLFGRNARRMPLLLAVVGFIEMTAIAFVFVRLVAAGSPDRLTLAFAGFATACAVLGRRVPRSVRTLGRGAAPAGREEPLRQQPLDRLA